MLVRYLDVHQRFCHAIGSVWRGNSELYESWSMLQYVDPYGMTLLNRLQLERFVVELQELQNTMSDPQTLSVIATIRGMALYCLDHVHTYLWFDGD